MKQIPLKVLLLSVLLLLYLVSSSFAVSMVLVTPRSPDSQDGRWFYLVYTEAFKRLGWRFVYEDYPSNRCSFLSNNGKVDGEMERVYNFNTLFPNLIRVEQSLRTLNFVAYARDPNIKLSDWTKLKNSDYLIDCRRGLKLCVHDLLKFVDRENLFLVNSLQSGIKRLIQGRTDVYVDFETVINNALKAGKIDQNLIHFSGLLHEIDVYPFLHKKHAERAPALAKALSEMKKEGLLSEYWKRANKMQ